MEERSYEGGPYQDWSVAIKDAGIQVLNAQGKPQTDHEEISAALNDAGCVLVLRRQRYTASPETGSGDKPFTDIPDFTPLPYPSKHKILAVYKKILPIIKAAETIIRSDTHFPEDARESVLYKTPLRTLALAVPGLTLPPLQTPADHILTDIASDDRRGKGYSA
jgi:hypothetical protein